MALYGPAGWAAGGALVGGTNAWLSGGSGSDIAMGVGVGAFSGLVGGAAGSWASQSLGGVVINGFNISSPIVKGLVGGAIGGGAGGYAGGFAGGLMMSGGDLKAANKAGMSGLTSGLVIGSITGGMGAYMSAKNAGVNPWTGRRDNSIVIGRNMEGRVNPVARDLGAETISNDWNNATDFYSDPLAGKEFNRNWLQGRMDNGAFIYDIGTGGASQGMYYGMEQRLIINYSNTTGAYYWNPFGLRIIYYGR